MAKPYISDEEAYRINAEARASGIKVMRPLSKSEWTRWVLENNDSISPVTNGAQPESVITDTALNTAGRLRRGEYIEAFNGIINAVTEAAPGFHTTGGRGTVQTGRYKPVHGMRASSGRRTLGSPLLGRTEDFVPVRTISVPDIAIPKDVAKAMAVGFTAGATVGTGLAGGGTWAAGTADPVLRSWFAPLVAAYKMGGQHKEEVKKILWGSSNPGVRANPDAVIAEMESRLGGPNEGRAVAKWVADSGNVSVPEALADVELALRTARAAKGVDLAKETPQTILQKYYKGRQASLAYRNPDKIKEFTGKSVVSEELGIVAYDVPDTPEARVACRELINFHKGTKSNPWCVLTSDGLGNLTPGSGNHWKKYDAVPRKIFFQNGELLAFRATSSDGVGAQEYWDVADRGWPQLPVAAPWTGTADQARNAEAAYPGFAKSKPYRVLLMDPDTGETTSVAAKIRGEENIVLFGRNDKVGTSGKMSITPDGRASLYEVTQRDAADRLTTTRYSDNGAPERKVEQILTPRYLRERGYDTETPEGNERIRKDFKGATADWANPVAKILMSQSTLTPDGADAHRIVFDDRGKLTEVWERENGELVQRERRVFDDRGRETERWNRRNGELTPFWRDVFDDRGRRTERWERENGELAPIWRDVFDDRGNKTERWERENGELAPIWRKAYNDRGNRTERWERENGELVQLERRVFDDHGRETERWNRKNGELVQTDRNVFDDRGNQTEWWNRENGELVQTLRYVFDDRGNRTERWKREDGELVQTSRNVFDDRGSQTERWDRENGELVQTGRNVFDDLGRQTEAWERKNGELVQTERNVFDDRGSQTEWWNRKNGELAPAWRNVFDDRGRQTEWWKRENGELVQTRRNVFDDRGNRTERWDRENGELVQTERNVFDDHGHHTEWWERKNGELVQTDRNVFDDRGNQTEWWGRENGELVQTRRNVFDDRGSRTERWEREDGALVQAERRVFDDRGNRTERWERENGELVQTGRYVFDDRGNQTEEWKRKNGELVQAERYVFDDRGNRTEWWNRENGELVQAERYVFDDRGNKTERWKREDGEMVQAERHVFDDRGNQTEWWEREDGDLVLAWRGGPDDNNGDPGVTQDAKGGDVSGESSGPARRPQTQVDPSRPRIVVNPKVFSDKRDALCVALNEAFRIVMEANGFDPVSEPTPAQRKFFADTAYSQDENMLRRTILARIATFDTSVKDPTDEQLQETVEFLHTVLEIGAPQNEWEQNAVRRILTVLEKTVELGKTRAQEAPQEEAPQGEAPQEEAPQEEAPQ